MTPARSLLTSILFCLITSTSTADDTVTRAFDVYLAPFRNGQAPFSYDRSNYEGSPENRAGRPIGVFDSGIGGLTVLESLLTADLFDNKTLKPGPDGRPDFEQEKFIYLGDQANMPYGNYSAVGKTDYLRELILKDATFLLGNRYRESAASRPRFNKPPVKAIVIACNTATAYGLQDIRAAMKRWHIPVIVVGVVEAGARGLLQREENRNEAIGVLATVGTCASGVYPKTIKSTLGQAGRRAVTVTQHGSADLAAIIEGESGMKASLTDQIESDARALLESHQESRKGKSPDPIGTIVLGCTHFPLVMDEIEAAFTQLHSDKAFKPFLAESRHYIDPAAWTARELFLELSRQRIRATSKTRMATKRDAFYLSVPNPKSDASISAPEGGLKYAYKYGRRRGDFSTEDTVVIPMTRAALPAASRKLVQEKLPETWNRLPAGEQEDLNAAPLVTAGSWAIADGKTGQILWEHRARVPRKSASLTKTMCALVVLSLARKVPSVLDETITFSMAAGRTGGSTSNVKAAEQVSVREGLYGLLLPSGNDMGNAIAEHFHARLKPPTKEMLNNGLDHPDHRNRINFIAEMNRFAERIGMANTFYRIAYGDGGTLDQKTTTAADLCVLAHHAMAAPLFRNIVRTRRHTASVICADGSKRKQIWQNSNELLFLDRGYDGIKTGTTTSAGRCLLASGERNDRRLVVVVLGADSARARWTDARNLFRWAWNNLEQDARESN